MAIDYEDIPFDKKQILIDNPDTILPLLDNPRISKLPDQTQLRQIDVNTVGKLISVPGIVVRTTEVKPMGTKIAFRCENNKCGVLNEGKIVAFSVKKPRKCTNCGETELELDLDNSNFVNLQKVRLQELPEDLPAGQLPAHIDVTMLDDLVNECRPGDRVLLTGIPRMEQEEQTTIFTVRMEGNNVEYIGGSQDKSMEITETDEYEILALRAQENFYQNLISSFAPNIFGNDTIKESILMMIVGSLSREQGNQRRGDINVFLVGDPGLAKSELLKFAAEVAPRGMYTSGRGVTAAGLTAAVVRQDEMFALEAGAIVLSDQGICCIDEMDKISDNDRSALHEVMEQQTCSVAKGGIVATLNARTSILAAANPRDGKYDMAKSIKDNVEPIPVPLLTRFDLIHIVRDTKDPEVDKLIAAHIHSMQDKEVDIDILRKYLAYAKKIQPKETKEATDVIDEFYFKMRQIDSDVLTVTPRQLEGLVRIATAHAKLSLKDYVDKEDAQRAIDLVMKSMDGLGINIETGAVVKQMGKMNKEELFKSMFVNGPISGDYLVDSLVKTGEYTEAQARSRIQKGMRSGGDLMEPTSGVYRLV